MAEFNLTAETILSNHKKFKSRIDKIFPDRAEKLHHMYNALGEDRMAFAPASSTNYFHNAIPGGYIDHILRVMDFAVLEYKHYETLGLDISNFTLQELMFAAMHHDLGKMGFVGEDREGYILNKSEWHRTNQGKMYNVNPEIPWALIQDRSLFLLQQFGITCTWNEWQGIRIHDGIYDEANKQYFISHSLPSKLRTNLPQILHQADMAAARWEFERWNKVSKSLNTTDKPSEVKPKAERNKFVKETNSNSVNKSDFDELFKEG